MEESFKTLRDENSNNNNNLELGFDRNFNVCLECTPLYDKEDCIGNNQQSRTEKCNKIPLPQLPWINASKVWQNIVYNGESNAHTRNYKLFQNNPNFSPCMRSILMDWIMQICLDLQLRRTTYYLAVHYIDRFLTIISDVPGGLVQLIGISSLFIASKFEETYPPRLSDFLRCCEGVCTKDNILECELLILNAFEWNVNPMTVSGWLSLYMQIHCTKEHFLYPQYSSFHFVLACHLIDLFSLDPNFLLFNYNVIAASAIYYLFGKSAALKVSGLVWEDLKQCINYMIVFNSIISQSNDFKLLSITDGADRYTRPTYGCLKPLVPNLNTNENHKFQTHIIDLTYFERATLFRLQQIGFGAKKCSEERSEGIIDNSNQAYTEKRKKFYKMTYKVEKIGTKLGCATITVPNIVDAYFRKKAKYTIDEIIKGINLTSKVLLDSNVEMVEKD